MKKFLLIAAIAISMASFAKYVDPNPYANYSAGMAPVKGHTMAIAWHATDRAKIDEATAPANISAILASEEKIKALLGEIKEAYQTDELAAAKIAAISQFVMKGAQPKSPWWKFWSSEKISIVRQSWANALIERIKSTDDNYIKEYCLDQLRWCGYAKLTPEIVEIAKTSDKAVSDMAMIVIDQINQ
jgi:hypothetical protein